jgi:hypothetical protein
VTSIVGNDHVTRRPAVERCVGAKGRSAPPSIGANHRTVGWEYFDRFGFRLIGIHERWLFLFALDF